MRRQFVQHWALIIALITTQAWLLGPALNHHLSFSKAYVSDLFLPTQPWSWLFRLLEIISGVTLFIASYQSIQKSEWYKRRVTLWLVRILAILTIIDGIFIDACSSQATSCHLSGLILYTSLLHGIESIFSVVILLALALLSIGRRAQFRRLGYGFFICLVIILSLQLAGPYSVVGKGIWQRAFITLSTFPIGFVLLT